MDNRARVKRPEWPPVFRGGRGWMDKWIIGSGLNVLSGHPYLKGGRGWIDDMI